MCSPTDADSLRSYLSTKSINPHTITPLTGGTANFLFRITTTFPTTTTATDSPDNSSTQIIKHAGPYIAASCGNANIPFPVQRMDYEVTALQTIGALLSPRGIGTGNEGAGKGCSETSAVAVKLPKLLDYDAEVKVLMMSDGGLRTLKDAYADMGGEEIRECGRMLGNWLARLHYLTRETDIGEWGNPIGKSMYRWAYSRLHEVAEEYGLDVEFAKYIDRKFGALLATDDECVCHGDFWPGNVLLDEDGNNENERKEGGLTVVDWEMCRRGCGATDVGQFAAETWLVDRFSGGKELQGAFLRGYREVKEGEKTANRGEFLRRVAVHMGVHLAYWPARVEWAGEEETRVVVALGHELIRKGNEGDFEWLGREWLGGLVGR